MVWDQLSINKPHLVYIILGGFTSIFMLVSLFIKEKLYIGEATVATLCGLIFGPHAANLINPLSWGNTDQITLEFSRIVLVVQCFAVGVELPKAYMERHWVSVTLLLVPVMTFGWLITSLFIWWLIEPLTWLESLCAAACVTATDPVLASSVVGKGKFAKRVPKHIRDLLSAESGCNDGMAFPFIYLALNLIHYHLDANKVTEHWVVNTILYECIWGAVYGVLVGYIARQAIKLAERKGIIDRESFLVFYFVLALFCAGSGSMLGMDDLLIGFAAGVGFSNDGWFTEKTEESHVSNVIDLLLNLTYFVYLGTIIPWDQYNSTMHGLEPWRLVVIAILVVLFRRIPIMLLLKPIIPDIKTWREALFCGHFGPIGVGAIFVAILARAELETGSTTPLAVLPDPSVAEYTLIYTIWPITTFLVIASIVVHGSSIAVFTLGKRINTLTMTLSYTTGNDQSSNWMNRLPRITSTSRSQGRASFSDMSDDEKADFPPGQLPPVGIPKLHLKRLKDEEYEKPRASSRTRRKRRKRKSNYGAGGPVDQSAIQPQRRSEPSLAQTPDVLDEKADRPTPERANSEDLNNHRAGDSDPEQQYREKETLRAPKSRGRSKTPNREDGRDVEIEAFEERHHLVIEDEEGNVLRTVETRGKSREEKAEIIDDVRNQLRKDTSGQYAKHKHEPHERNEEEELEHEVENALEHPQKNLRDMFKGWKGFGRGADDSKASGAKKAPERKRGAAHAYQFGNTIIIEDEDGEVIHKYTIPKAEGESNKYNEIMRDGMQRMSTWVGLGRTKSHAPDPASAENEEPKDSDETSSGSPDKEKEEADTSNKAAGTEAKHKKKGGNEDEFGADDDGLRMVISNAEQYGLTGLHKQRDGDRPSILGSRRMSTKDFVAQLQAMNKTDRNKMMNKTGMSEGTQREVNRTAKLREDRDKDGGDRAERPGVRRAGTTPLPKHKSPIHEEEEEEATDYFAQQPSSPYSQGRGRSQSDAYKSKRPEPVRSQTDKTDRSTATRDSDSDASEDDIPTHNIRGAIARHGRAGGNVTAADARRQRHLSTIASGDRIDERDEDEDQQVETAAEKRRRLAALGIGSPSGSRSDSSDEDDDNPRVPRGAVQEPRIPERAVQPPPAQPEIQQAPAPRMKVQWGGETRGVVRGKGADDVERQGGSGSHQSFGKRFKKFLDS